MQSDLANGRDAWHMQATNEGGNQHAIRPGEWSRRVAHAGH
jgi:hypothetical protein